MRADDGGGNDKRMTQGIAEPAFETLPREQLEDMRRAGDEVAECHRVLRKAGLNVVGELLKHQGKFVQLSHYPKGDVFDRDTHAQYSSHAHRAGEHGHFHCFLRAAGMPAGVAPVPEATGRDWPAGDKALAHLIAISMDRHGNAIKLFTTNQWVTGETFYPADSVIAMLDRFVIDHAWPSWPTNRWVSAMMRLFRPQIEALIRARDLAIEKRRAQDPQSDIFTDRQLETISETAIDVEAQRARIARALG